MQNKSRQNQIRTAMIGQQKKRPSESLQEKEQKFSLYLFLQIDKDASHEQIRKQYKKLVFKYHPDKNKEDPQARQKFQKLKQAYDILSDPEKKKQYDQTGFYGQNFDEGSFQAAYEYYRKMYKKVTEQDIVEFEKEYRQGAMQEQDLIDYYKTHEGDMRQLIESIPLSKNSDIQRFIKFFQNKIKEKQLPQYKSFNKTKNKVKKLQDQSAQFQQMEKQKLNSLVLAIRGKQSGNKDFLAQLQAKYGGGTKKRSKKQTEHVKSKKKKA